MVATCHTVVSSDGTPIGYWSSGHGPPLVLVHGGLGDHTRWDTLRPHLEPHVTVHAMDRRGRGASGDAPDWTPAREPEDVAAVVDAVAAETGSPVDVLGHSGGGFSAFPAATLTANIRRLVLYEGWPPVDPESFRPPAGLLERLEALLAAGDLEAVLEVAYREALHLSDEELEARRARPEWANRVAAAPTVPRELRAFSTASAFDPEQAAAIAVPTLLLVGSESPVWRAQVGTIEAALPDARVVVLDGHGHHADLEAPAQFAEQVLAFLHAA